MCNNKTFKVKYQYKSSDTFKVKSGLHQGDVLSPMLFNVALEWVMRTTRETQKMDVGGIDMILFIIRYGCFKKL